MIALDVGSVFAPRTPVVDDATGLLASIGLEDPGRAAISAARVIAVEASHRKLRVGPWSLAELAPSDEDYEWLLRWAERLDEATATRLMTDPRSLAIDGGAFSASAVIGTLLLFLAAEVARRETREGTLWPALDGAFATATNRVLFQGGQPTDGHRASIRAAARRLGLRHVFDVAGVQPWLDTVFLQFGMTFRGATSQLPTWLAGEGRPQAVVCLLGGSLASGSFRRVWDGLRNLQRGRVHEAEVRLLVKQSPWLLPSWASDVLASARIDRAPRARPAEQGIPRALLEGPFLQWRSGASPTFVCTVGDTSSLTASRYDVRHGGVRCGVLLRQQDGTYRFLAPGPLALPVGSPRLEIEFVSDLDEPRSLSLDAWSPDEDVTLFDLRTGERINDPWQEPLDERASYALITAADLRVVPEEAEWAALDQGRAHAHLLAPGSLADTRVLLDDEVLWAPVIAASRGTSHKEPWWCKDVNVRIVGAARRNVGREVAFLISHPAHVDVRFARAGATTLLCDPTTGGTEARLVAMRLIAKERGLVLHLRLRQGADTVTIARHVTVEVVGTVVGQGDDARVLAPDAVRTVADFEQQSTRTNAPAPDDLNAPRHNEQVYFEGAVCVARMSGRGRKLKGLHGVGAPLVVRFQEYNAPDVIQPVARAIVDPGVLRDVVFEPRRLVLHLHRDITPGTRHAVLWWAADGRLEVLSPQLLTSCGKGGSSWAVERSSSAVPLAIAIAYDGDRSGAWWNLTTDGLVSLDATCAVQPERSAALLRWLHWPVLAEGTRGTVRLAVNRGPIQFLAVWLDARTKSIAAAPGTSLTLKNLDERWLAATRAICEGWIPTPRQIDSLVAALGCEADEEEALGVAAEALNRLDPVLMARVVRARMDVVRRSAGVETARATIGMLRASFTRGCSEGTVLEAASDVLGVDSGFVELGLARRAQEALSGRILSTLDRANAAAALACPQYRTFLADRLLEALSANL